jgi:hypothetical protein
MYLAGMRAWISSQAPKTFLKNIIYGQAPGVTAVILATQEAEIRRIMVQGQPREQK